MNFEYVQTLLKLSDEAIEEVNHLKHENKLMKETLKRIEAENYKLREEMEKMKKSLSEQVEIVELKG